MINRVNKPIILFVCGDVFCRLRDSREYRPTLDEKGCIIVVFIVAPK